MSRTSTRNQGLSSLQRPANPAGGTNTPDDPNSANRQNTPHPNRPGNRGKLIPTTPRGAVQPPSSNSCSHDCPVGRRSCPHDHVEALENGLPVGEVATRSVARRNRTLNDSIALSERERPEGRPAGRRCNHPMTEHRRGSPGAQHVGVIDVRAASEHRLLQREHRATILRRRSSPFSPRLTADLDG